jgi:archaellum component FlaC
MSEQGTFVEDGIERIQNAVESIEDEFQKLHRNVLKRRKSFGTEARKQVKRAQTELRKSPVVKRAEGLRKDINKQVEGRMDSFFGLFPYATRKEVKRLERKVSQLTRKLNQLEKATGVPAREETASETQH